MGRKRANLRLIHGGLHYEVIVGDLNIIAAPEYSQPFHVDAVVFEEDTWLIMSADPKIVDYNIHPIRLMNEVMKIKPKPLGSIVVKNSTPIHFLAIVHDVDQDPTWKEEWIKQALDAVFTEAEKRKINTLGLPLIGCQHGSLAEKRFLTMLKQKIETTGFQFMRKIWLITKKENHCDIVDCMTTVFHI